MSHVFHPSILLHGLVDDCPGCESKVRDPVGTLDRAHLQAAWDQMLSVEFDDGGVYRSIAEAEACRKLLVAARLLQRCGVDPADIHVET